MALFPATRRMGFSTLTSILVTLSVCAPGLPAMEYGEVDLGTISLVEVGETCESACGCSCQTCDDCGDCCCCEWPFVPFLLGDSLGPPRVIGQGATFVGIPRHFTKVADNNTVLPQDRLSFNYNFMNNVPTLWTDLNGTNAPGPSVTEDTDISEFELLLEKTFLQGMLSLQFIVPMYHTVDFQQAGVATWGREDTELGNLAFGLKVLTISGEKFNSSAGLLAEAPTASEIVFTPGFSVDSDYWWLTPYLAFAYTPTERAFAQLFTSYRARTGFDVELPLTRNTQYNDPGMLMVDGGLGYWLFWNPGGYSRIAGLAPTVELHYTTSTERDPPSIFTSRFFGQVDYLNLTAGTTVLLNSGSTLGLGLAVPLRDNVSPGGNLPTDRTYDAEAIVQYNRRW